MQQRAHAFRYRCDMKISFLTEPKLTLQKNVSLHKRLGPLRHYVKKALNILIGYGYRTKNH